MTTLDPKATERARLRGYTLKIYGDDTTDKIITAYLSALPAQPAGPRLVPVEPTEAMIDAACGKWVNLHPSFTGEKPSPTAGEVVETIYRAMLAAAPASPSVDAPIPSQQEVVTEEMVEAALVDRDRVKP